ncbi:asparaginase [Marinovum sp.]|uniref:asparaginase n=1 Tax=Marinovum sp. TaxID=2024839 RepID=UPI003A91C4D4
MSILLIHTGGTIGMVQTAQGFAPRTGIVEEAVADLLAKGEVTGPIEILRLDPLIDSAQATPEDWRRVAQSIHDASGKHEAFVVTHGTDTLAYTAAALCLALPGLEKPVIVTGAMLPLTVAGTDGRDNLIAALNVARTAGPGVRVQFGGQLLHGARVRKSHSQAFDAFEAATSDQPPLMPAESFGLNAVQRHKVGILSVAPGCCMALFAAAAEVCDGLVLRCFGSGTAPDTPEMRAALQAACAREVPVLAVSQCPEGGMRLGTYAAGQVLQDTGVVDGRDMSPEMAFAKMQFALSLTPDFEARRDFLATPQCGEMLAP